MKRNAPETVDSRSSKRLKAGSSKEDDDANFQPLLARCPRDLVTLAAQGKKLPKPPGHLRGTIVRKLNTTVPKDRLFLIKVPVLTTKTRQQLQFEVLFRSRVQGDLDSLNSLKAGDEVLLSLKGASAPAAAQAHSEPFRLTYHTGFHLKWKGREFNTWNGTVKQSSSSPVKEPEEHSPQLTKRQQRLLRRQQKEDNDPSEGPCATKDGPGRQETPVKEEMHSQPIPPPRSPGPPAPSEAQQRPVDHLESNTETMALLKSLGYTTLKKAVAKSAVSYGDLIGVVVGCRELRQSSRGDGDWNRQIRIVDPSMVDEDDILSIKGFGVILFANQKEFLPDPIVGDVLVLHHIRLSNNHLPAVGNRSGGFRWALYSGNGFHHGVNSVTVLTEGASTPMFHPPTESRRRRRCTERVVGWSRIQAER
ncbi:hypothetical protein CC2G_005496 [Coprinopsis cinerea AmutBmut pab1-1]|nr:hypothetical protein CC2G_005496 [Coprinopsis cinerea AmutBmut pab1-1]